MIRRSKCLQNIKIIDVIDPCIIDIWSRFFGNLLAPQDLETLRQEFA